MIEIQRKTGGGMENISYIEKISHNQKLQNIQAKTTPEFLN